MTNRLLVSVRSAAEAAVAIQGGASVIDVKEPGRGSLGMADAEIVQQVGDFCRDRCEVSVALGELARWQPLANVDHLRTVRYVKIALAGMRWVVDWPDQLRRWQFDHGFSNQKMVAAAYVDFTRSASPDPRRILELAVSLRWRGFLVDTWKKDGKWLGDWISIEQLAAIRRICQQHGLLFAIAGCLNRQRIEELSKLGADLYAVRGAACFQGRRDGQVSLTAVRQLCEAVRVPNEELDQTAPLL